MLAVVAVFSLAFAAQTQTDQADPVGMKRASATLYEEGRAKYRSAQFEAAAQLFERAHALDPDPKILFDWACALDAAGDPEEAVEKYASYVAALPNGEHKPLAERRLAQLAKIVTEEPRDAGNARAAPEVQASTKVGPPQAPRSATPWIVMGAGAAGLVAGGVLGALAVGRRQKALDEPINETAAGYAAEAKDLGSIANIAYAAGGAVVLSGFIWLIIDRSSSDATAKVGALVGPDGFTIAGTF